MATTTTRLPVTWKQRWCKRTGDRAVQCQASNRWLAFPGTGARSGNEEWMVVNVMTLDASEEPRKFCEIVIAREDLMRALRHVASPDRSTMATADRAASV